MAEIKKFREFSEILSEPTPTAVEFSQSFEEDENDDFFYKAMVEFAKLHVSKALKAAHSNMQLPAEDLDFTMQSYPLNKIT